jgi:cobalamin biosynthesis protein CbiG
MLVDVTSYDTLGSSKVVPLTAGSAGAVLLATGFDGIVGVAPSATTATKPAST